MRNRARAALILVLLIGAAELASAQSRPSTPVLSVTILLDLSYGMRLPLSLNKDDRSSPSRLDEARALLHSVVSHGAPGTRWSLVTFGGTPEAPADSGPRLRLGFSTDRAAIETEVSRLSTWGVSPLSDAILYALRYSDRTAPTSRRVLLVVTDGIDTEPSLFEMPSPETLKTFATRVVFAGITSPHSPLFTERLRRWTRSAGARFVNGADPAAVEEALQLMGDQRPAARAAPPGLRPPANSPTPKLEIRRAGGIGRRGALAFVPLPLLLAAAYLLRRRRRVRELPPPAEVLRFHFESRDRSGERELREPPVELSLDAGGSNAPLVELRAGRAYLISASPVLVNGVGVRRAALAEGDRVRVGTVMWHFRGVGHESSALANSTADLPFWPAAAAAAAVAVLLIIGLGTLEGGGAAAPRAAAAETAGSTTAAPSGERDTAAAAGISLGNERSSVGLAPVALAGVPDPAHAFIHTEMIAPGDRPRFFKADVMFIHTHPDDDSIDFGGLMAVESRAGKRVVTVVFTDGNAGLDQFPNRRVGGLYPPHILRGSALAAVRVREAEAALSILGAREYIRLGLLNNPYDSITEILPLHEVLKRWGGEARLVRELAGLIRGFRPEIVVSPDERHPGVFKHFEHEAVGYLTDRALAYLADRGEGFVRAHLIAVDPMLTSRYRGVFGVNVMALAPQSGLTYRAIQVAALKKHVTQRDASVIGVEVVPNFEDEYYVARTWGFSLPPQEYFARLTDTGGG